MYMQCMQDITTSVKTVLMKRYAYNKAFKGGKFTLGCIHNDFPKISKTYDTFTIHCTSKVHIP